MMIDWTSAFIVLRNVKIDRNREKVEAVLNYLRIQQCGMKCLLCDFDLNTQGLLCKRCFRHLHPAQIDLKMSIVVEYALLMHTIEQSDKLTEIYANTNAKAISEIDVKRFEFLGVPIDCTSKDFYRLFLNIAFTDLTHTEELILENIKIKMHRYAIYRWKAYKHKSIIDALDVQYNTVKLNYLVSLRNLHIDDAWLLKKHLLEIQKYKNDLIAISKTNQLRRWMQ
ncbi:hypothetical protein HK407_11g16590 [Ordospora pajunii]|uniref:uncharacterized protein n=1 Tax=Ordospora pajunii TaxID=3039483 RepID=UPI00295267DB|nr:uncharacterized protein HK407_11g16590 [Ordospora pajunii]KAH9410765.1 hypothetical protein HK407_11g16590 [Ordospora pajunii]